MGIHGEGIHGEVLAVEQEGHCCLGQRIEFWD